MEKVLKYLKTFISSKGDWKVFVICLVIATVLWLFQSMSLEYGTELSVHINYINQPDNKTFSTSPPSEVKVKVQGFGWDLLAYKFKFTRPEFDFNMSQISGEQVSTRDLILEAVPGLTNILSITPERFEILLEDAAQRRVPVISKLQINPATGFGFVSALAEPDSITLFGATGNIEGIKEVYTEDASFSELEGETSFSAALEIPEGVSVIGNTDDVTVKVLCEPFTEKELQVVIKVMGYSGEKKVNIYPRLATLKLKTTISQFDKVDPSDFEVFVDLSNSNDDELLEVQVKNNSQWVSSHRVSPKYVDYFLEN